MIDKHTLLCYGVSAAGACLTGDRLTAEDLGDSLEGDVTVGLTGDLFSVSDFISMTIS